MKQTIRMIGASALVALLLLAGCSGPFDAPNPAGGPNGNVWVQIGPDADSRTLAPGADQFDGYRLDFTNQGSQRKFSVDLGLGVTGKDVKLETGNWTIRATGLVDGKDAVYGTARDAVTQSTSIQIKAGESARVNILLDTNVGSEAGIFRYSVTFPDLDSHRSVQGSYARAEFVFTPTDGTNNGTVRVDLVEAAYTNRVQTTEDADGNLIYTLEEDLELPPGQYEMNLNLVSQRGIYNGVTWIPLGAYRKEVVYIYSNMVTSTPEYKFAADKDFSADLYFFGTAMVNSSSVGNYKPVEVQISKSMPSPSYGPYDPAFTLEVAEDGTFETLFDTTDLTASIVYTTSPLYIRFKAVDGAKVVYSNWTPQSFGNDIHGRPYWNGINLSTSIYSIDSDTANDSFTSNYYPLPAGTKIETGSYYGEDYDDTAMGTDLVVSAPVLFKLTLKPGYNPSGFRYSYYEGMYSAYPNFVDQSVDADGNNVFYYTYDMLASDDLTIRQLNLSVVMPDAMFGEWDFVGKGDDLVTTASTATISEEGIDFAPYTEKVGGWMNVNAVATVVPTGTYDYCYRQAGSDIYVYFKAGNPELLALDKADATTGVLQFIDTSTTKATFKSKGSSIFTVTFDSDGGSTVASQIVTGGLKVPAPTVTAPNPTWPVDDATQDAMVAKMVASITEAGLYRPEKVLLGWFKADNTQWDFATDAVTADMTLKAKWSDVVGIFVPGGYKNDMFNGLSEAWYQGYDRPYVLAFDQDVSSGVWTMGALANMNLTIVGLGGQRKITYTRSGSTGNFLNLGNNSRITLGNNISLTGNGGSGTVINLPGGNVNTTKFIMQGNAEINGMTSSYDGSMIEIAGASSGGTVIMKDNSKIIGNSTTNGGKYAIWLGANTGGGQSRFVMQDNALIDNPAMTSGQIIVDNSRNAILEVSGNAKIVGNVMVGTTSNNNHFRIILNSALANSINITRRGAISQGVELVRGTADYTLVAADVAKITGFWTTQVPPSELKLDAGGGNFASLVFLPPQPITPPAGFLTNWRVDYAPGGAAGNKFGNNNQITISAGEITNNTNAANTITIVGGWKTSLYATPAYYDAIYMASDGTTDYYFVYVANYAGMMGPQVLVTTQTPANIGDTLSASMGASHCVILVP